MPTEYCAKCGNPFYRDDGDGFICGQCTNPGFYKILDKMANAKMCKRCGREARLIEGYCVNCAK